MKLLNTTTGSIFLWDIGYNKNGGPMGRASNQARYIPSSLTNGVLDVAKYVQLVETGAVKMSAAKGQISKFVALGYLVELSVGENLERTLSVTKTNATKVPITTKFFDDVTFGRPILLTKLDVSLNQAVAGGKTLRFNFNKNNVLKATNYDMVTGDGTSKSFSTAAIAGGNDWDYNDLLDLVLVDVATDGTDTNGLTSITAKLTYELV